MQLVVLLGLFGLACKHEPERPDTRIPTEHLRREFRKLRKRVHKHVSSPERRDAALELIARGEQQATEISLLLREWRESFTPLPEDQRYDRAVIAQVAEHLSERLGAIARKAGAIAVELRCHITPAEWSKVFSSPGREAGA